MSTRSHRSTGRLAKPAIDLPDMNTALSPQPPSPPKRLERNRQSLHTIPVTPKSNSSASNSSSVDSDASSEVDSDESSTSDASDEDEDEDDSDEEAVDAPSDQSACGQAGPSDECFNVPQPASAAFGGKTAHMQNSVAPPPEHGEEDNDEFYLEVDDVPDDEDDVQGGEETIAAIQSRFPNRTMDELVVLDDLVTTSEDHVNFNILDSIHEHASVGHDPHTQAALQNMASLDENGVFDASPISPSTPVTSTEQFNPYTVNVRGFTPPQTITNPCRILPASMVVGGYTTRDGLTGYHSDSATDEDLPPSAFHAMVESKAPRKVRKSGRKRRRARGKQPPKGIEWAVNPRLAYGCVYEDSNELDIRPPTRGDGPYNPPQGSTWAIAPEVTATFGGFANAPNDDLVTNVDLSNAEQQAEVPLPSVEVDESVALEDFLARAAATEPSPSLFALPDFADAGAFRGLRFNEANSDHESEDIDCGVRLEDFLVETDSSESGDGEDAQCLKFWSADGTDAMEGIEELGKHNSPVKASKASPAPRPQMQRREHSGLSITKRRTRASAASITGKRKATGPLRTNSRPATRQCR